MIIDVPFELSRKGAERTSPTTITFCAFRRGSLCKAGALLRQPPTKFTKNLFAVGCEQFSVSKYLNRQGKKSRQYADIARLFNDVCADICRRKPYPFDSLAANDDVYAIYFETDNQPRIERVRVRGVLVTAAGVFVCTRDGGEHLLGRDAFPEYEDAAATVEAILEERRKKKCKKRKIRLIVL